MKILYRGFDLEEKREKALGGWKSTYYNAFHATDGTCLEDNFTEGQEPKGSHIEFMKKIVDAFIDHCASDLDLIEVARDIACGESVEEAFKFHGKAKPAGSHRE